MVAAVILGKDWNAEHPLNDSKKLSSTKREQLFDVICSEALAFKIVSISAEEIDRLNILQATLHGMLRCLTEIEPAPDYALVDGNRFPQTTIRGEAVVKGDGSFQKHCCSFNFGQSDTGPSNGRKCKTFSGMGL